MKKTKQKITRFEDGKFYVDIVETGDGFEAWIAEKDSGLSALMFGVPRRQEGMGDTTFHSFCELVEDNLAEHEANYLAFINS